MPGRLASADRAGQNAGLRMPKLVMAIACSRCENAKDKPTVRRSRSRNRVNGPGRRLANDDAVNAARNSRNDVRAVTRIATAAFGCIGMQGEGRQRERDQDHGDGHEQAPAVQEGVLDAAMVRPRSRGGSCRPLAGQERVVPAAGRQPQEEGNATSTPAAHSSSRTGAQATRNASVATPCVSDNTCSASSTGAPSSPKTDSSA